MAGLEASAPDLLVRDDVVALVGVLADRRLDVAEAGQLALDAGAELELREVGAVETDVVDLAAHRLEALERVQEGARDVPHVDEVAPEVALEDDQRRVVDGP